MPAFTGKMIGHSQSGKVQVFSILIIIMILVCAYEIGTIYSDWKDIKKTPLKISIINDLRAPVPEASVSINGAFVGQTNDRGELAVLLPKAEDIQITAVKKPLSDFDTTVSVTDAGMNIILAMARPHSSFGVFVKEESGKPLSAVNVVLNDKDFGTTGEDGILSIGETFYLNDNIRIKLSKKGFNDLVTSAVLSEPAQVDSLTMKMAAVKTVEKPKPAPPPPPKPDFQSHFDLANKYLDRAISGQAKYFGSSLREIDQAIAARPSYLPAKQLKVEILYNFAKSLRDSQLLYEAANRCAEALKVYNQIPQDQMYEEIQKLKSEIDKSLK